MTTAVADSLLDWTDADSDDRENGAEADDYAGLDPPYAPRNGLPESLDELLLVRGVTRELLFGHSAERELAAEAEAGGSHAVGRFSRAAATDHVAWASLLTLHSAERNVNGNGRPRININAPDLTELHRSLTDVFDERYARFVALYRQHGPYLGAEPGADGAVVEFNPAVPARFPIVSLLDLIDARVAVPNASGAQPTVVASPFTGAREAMRQYLPKLLDEATVDGAPVLFGRVNVNEAHPLVLAAVPGLDGPLVEQILSARKNRVAGDDLGRRHPTWLLTDGLVDLPKMRLLLPYLTGGGDVHRAEIIGFFDHVGPSARTEFIIDAAARPARSLYWKDMRSLGPGHSLELIGVKPTAAEFTPRNDRHAGSPRAVLTQARAVPN